MVRELDRSLVPEIEGARRPLAQMVSTRGVIPWSKDCDALGDSLSSLDLRPRRSQRHTSRQLAGPLALVGAGALQGVDDPALQPGERNI